jgi:transposase
MSTDPTNVTAQASPGDLPQDVHTLQEMVLTLLAQIDDLNGQLYYLKRQLFGRKSEKLHPAQRLLFEGLYEQVQAQLEAQTGADKQDAPKRRSKPNATHNGRRPLPPELPRDEIVLEPAAEEKICPACQTPKQRIGEEITEKLEYIPASFRVKQYIRPKYACKQCQGYVSIGELPPMVIDKGIAGEGLLAHIITSKYTDHLPLKRLEGILKRHGVDINVSTMCDWVGVCADLLRPLVRRMHEKILQSPKINTDDTPVPVKSKKRKGSTYNGYLWVYVDDQKNVVFDFTPTRSRHGPLKFLGEYAGYVQADAYSGYDEFFRRSKATEVGCHAHARRKFDAAMDSDPVRASQMLALWKDLYAVEKTGKEQGYDATQLLAVRQELSGPILDKIHANLLAWKDRVLPKSPTGKAIRYALGQWTALTRYVDDPILEIDNNLAERTLRMVAVGRKNWQFAGSEAGAERAAVLYSLVAGCKLNGLDPFAYFRDVLGRISTHPASRIDELLPGHWQAPTTGAKPACDPQAA